MIMLGKKITQSGDKLIKLQVKQLAAKIRNPDEELLRLADSLTTLVVIDPEGYRRAKKMLPYVVPSIFYPPIRKKDNFAYSEHIILDFDHLDEKQLDPERLKDKLAKDDRVEMIFVSPSKQGLKVFFRLNRKISDHREYSYFYKKFAEQFALAYEVEQVVDMRTSDVTRACFLSFDPNLYYNEHPQPVDVDKFMSKFKEFPFFENTNKDRVKSSDKQEVILTKKKQKNDLPKDIFQQIKQKLDPNYKPPQPKKKVIFVPKHLEIVQEKVVEKLKEDFPDIQLESVKDINYGKQFLFRYDVYYAELNVFFGKRGLTVVKTSKKINNTQFQDLVYQIFYQIIYNDEEIQKITGANSPTEIKLPPQSGNTNAKEAEED